MTAETNKKVEMVGRLVSDLQRLAAKLLMDLSRRVDDSADSSLPEWLHEAQSLGVAVKQCKHCCRLVAGTTEICEVCSSKRRQEIPGYALDNFRQS